MTKGNSIKKISEEEVQKLALLARIKLTEEEEKNISNSSESILAMIDTILEVDIDESDIQRDYAKVNTMRDDVVEERTSKNRDNVLSELPQSKDDYLKTKKILG